jgi:LCP family protein required for cell wall assembly
MSNETAREPRAGHSSEHLAGPIRRSWGQRLVLLLNVILIIASLSTAGLLHLLSSQASSINRVALDRSLTEVTETETGERVLNILLVGSDSSANLDPDDPIQIDRQGERLGDVIIIAHLDERSGHIALLSLPRDLWVPISGAGRSDRINRSFVTGGPAGLIDTIEDTFDIPIHHYINVDFAGFRGLVEAVGTVEVPFDAPARDWNVNAEPEPRSQTGFLVTEAGCQSLGPEQALAYVRSRYYQTQDDSGEWHTDPTSDLGRISRQQDFLRRLLQKAIERGARNPMVLADLIDTGIRHVSIDQELTPALLIDLSATYRSFEPGDLQTYTFPAGAATVGANEVLLPNHDEAEPLLELFGGASFDDPRTIPVTVVTGPEGDAGAEGAAGGPSAQVIAALAEAGFDPDRSEVDGAGPGIWIRHGPGSAQVAETVGRVLLRQLDSDLAEQGVHLQATDGLTGRSIEVTVGSPEAAGPAADLVLPEGSPGAEPEGRSVVAMGDIGPTQPGSVAPSLGGGDKNAARAQQSPAQDGGCP